MGEDAGRIVMARLHRMVRHGWRPWLGYDVASGLDRVVELHRRGAVARMGPDGGVTFKGAPPGWPDAVEGADSARFDALFAPNTANKRNLMRRLYEIGLMG